MTLKDSFDKVNRFIDKLSLVDFMLVRQSMAKEDEYGQFKVLHLACWSYIRQVMGSGPLDIKDIINDMTVSEFQKYVQGLVLKCKSKDFVEVIEENSLQELEFKYHQFMDKYYLNGKAESELSVDTEGYLK